MLTEQEREQIHDHGHTAPVKVVDGFAVLVPCATDDWEIDVLDSFEGAVECGQYYWGSKFGTDVKEGE